MSYLFYILSRRNSVKIEAIHTMHSVFETDERMQGNWYGEFFGNTNPIVLELGCGRGEYSIALAQHFPEKNFIGIDIKGPRIWKGATAAESLGLKNVAFARFRIEYIQKYFQPKSISEVWIPFPDPFLRASKSGRRLTSFEFLYRYQSLLKDDAILQFKTDNTELYEWTIDLYKTYPECIEIIETTSDLHHSSLLTPYTSIPSKYEAKFMALGETIKYIKFRIIANIKAPL